MRIIIPGAPRYEDLVLLQGANLDRSYQWTEDNLAVDLTGATSPVIHFVQTKGGGALVTVTPTLGTTNGFIDYTVTPANITTLLATTSSGFYDGYITLSSGKIKRILQGAFTIDKAA